MVTGQQGAARPRPAPTWPAGGDARRGPALRGGGGRGHPGHPAAARVAGRRAGGAGHGHRERHHQLHPDPHGRRGERLRRRAGRGPAARAGRARPVGRRRGPRRRGQGGHPGRAWPSGADVVATDVHREGITRVRRRRRGLRRPARVRRSSCWPWPSWSTAAPRSRSGSTRRWCRGRTPWPRCAGVFNAVFVEGDAAGELMLYGRGAGGAPTASAVLGDLIDAARNLRRRRAGPGAQRRRAPRAAARATSARPSTSPSTWSTGPGVLAAVAKVFGDHGVSIRAMEQVGLGEEARLIFLTHDGARGRHAGDHRRPAPASQVVDRVGGVLRVIEAAPGRAARERGWRGVIEEYREFLPRRPRHAGGHPARGGHAAGAGAPALRAGRGADGLAQGGGGQPDRVASRTAA